MSEMSLEQFLPEQAVLQSMLSSGALWGLGDVMAQLIERYGSGGSSNKQLQTASSSSFLSFYSPLRTLRLSFYAALVWAPATHYWFQFLEYVFPGDGLLVAVKRMLLDQSVYAPLVIASLFFVVGALEGLSLRTVAAKTRDGFLPTLTRNWMLWPAAQIVLQGFVPMQHRIFIANCINLPWTAYLAYRAARSPPSASTVTTAGGSTAGGGGGKSSSGGHHAVQMDPDDDDDDDELDSQLGDLIDEP